MRNKTLIILAVIFLSQVVISCCDCGSPVTIENLYTDIKVTPYDNSGFTPEVAKNKVYKRAFGLEIYANYESKIYAQNSTSLSNFGFSSAMAFSCNCDYSDEYLYPNPISHMRIFIDDLQSEQRIDVTDCFQIRSYEGDNVSLDVFFENKDDWHDVFQIELVTHDSIPNAAIFIAEVFLESGESLKNQTDIVNFHAE